MAPSTSKASSASAWFSIFRATTRDHNRSARSFSRPAWAIATLAWRALDTVGIVSEEGKWFLPIVTTITRCSASMLRHMIESLTFGASAMSIRMSSMGIVTVSSSIATMSWPA